MTEAVLHGELLQAALLNPLLFAAAGGVGIWALASVAGMIPGVPAWRIEWEPGDRKRLWIVGGLAALLNWAYLIIRSF